MIVLSTPSVAHPYSLPSLWRPSSFPKNEWIDLFANDTETYRTMYFNKTMSIPRISLLDIY